MHGLQTLKHLNEAKQAQEILRHKDPNAEARRLQRTLADYYKALQDAQIQGN